MRGTIDKAGRVVVPKPLRDKVGLTAGEIELSVDGARLVIEPVHDDTLVEEDGFLVVPASGTPIDDDMVSALRRADQR